MPIQIPAKAAIIIDADCLVHKEGYDFFAGILLHKIANHQTPQGTTLQIILLCNDEHSQSHNTTSARLMNVQRKFFKAYWEIYRITISSGQVPREKLEEIKAEHLLFISNIETALEFARQKDHQIIYPEPLCIPNGTVSIDELTKFDSFLTQRLSQASASLKLNLLLSLDIDDTLIDLDTSQAQEKIIFNPHMIKYLRTFFETYERDERINLTVIFLTARDQGEAEKEWALSANNIRTALYTELKNDALTPDKVEIIYKKQKADYLIEEHKNHCDLCVHFDDNQEWTKNRPASDKHFFISVFHHSMHAFKPYQPSQFSVDQEQERGIKSIQWDLNEWFRSKIPKMVKKPAPSFFSVLDTQEMAPNYGSTWHATTDNPAQPRKKSKSCLPSCTMM